MNLALQKAIALMALIAIGLLLKPRIKSKEQAEGIKAIILNLALPATIFVALVKTEVQMSLLTLPLLALICNLALMGLTYLLLPLTGVERGTSEFRTLLLLVPSLAPGLSCFPVLAEYQGDQALAWAALGDLGNKIFVLIILYWVAMQWYYRFFPSANPSVTTKLKGLLLALLREPINLVLAAALLWLSLGWHMAQLPAFVQEVLEKISATMTPLVLLFVGISLQPRWRELRLLGGILCLRAGLGLLLSTFFLSLAPQLTPTATLLAIVFPLSAVSFWPFAHIAAVNALEGGGDHPARIFNPSLALNCIALSLPFSTLLILAISAAGPAATHPLGLGVGGLVLVAVAILPPLLRRIKLPTARAEVNLAAEHRPEVIGAPNL